MACCWLLVASVCEKLYQSLEAAAAGREQLQAQLEPGLLVTWTSCTIISLRKCVGWCLVDGYYVVSLLDLATGNKIMHPLPTRVGTPYKRVSVVQHLINI